MTDDTATVTAFSKEFASLRSLADRAVAQLDDDEFFRPLGSDGNSVAVLVKHIGGNLRSRWTDLFTTDGEKPDRWRDREFEREPGDTRASITAIWEAGWSAASATFQQLEDADLVRDIRIRGQAHTVIRALARSLAHTAGHVHQVVLLAKHWRGDRWQTLSIPRGQSEQFRVRMLEGDRPSSTQAARPRDPNA